MVNLWWGVFAPAPLVSTQGLVALDKGAGVKRSWYSLGSSQEQGEEYDGLHVDRYETG